MARALQRTLNLDNPNNETRKGLEARRRAERLVQKQAQAQANAPKPPKVKPSRQAQMFNKQGGVTRAADMTSRLEPVRVDPRYTRSSRAGPVQPSGEARAYTEGVARRVVPEKLPPKTLMQRGASGLRALGRGAVSPWNAVIAGVLPYDTATQEQEDVHRAAMAGKSYWDTPTGMRAQAAVPGTVGPISPSQQELTRRDYTRPGEEATVPQIQPEGLTRDPTYFGDDYLQNIKDPGLRRTIAADAYRRGAIQDPVEQARIEAMPPEDRPQGLASDMTAEDAYRRNRLKGMRAALRKTDPRLASKLDAQDRTAAGAAQTARTKERERLDDLLAKQEATSRQRRADNTKLFEESNEGRGVQMAEDFEIKNRRVLEKDNSRRMVSALKAMENKRNVVADALAAAQGNFLPDAWQTLGGSSAPHQMSSTADMVKIYTDLAKGLKGEVKPGDKTVINGVSVDTEDIMESFRERNISKSAILNSVGYKQNKDGGWDKDPTWHDGDLLGFIMRAATE